MSIEKIIRFFCAKKGYTLEANSAGFDGKKGEREEVFFDSINGKEQVLFCKSVALTTVSESSVYAAVDFPKKELMISVRYGCLRDYIHQLSASDKPLLVNLRKKLEAELEKQHLPMDWIEYTYTDFLKFDVYHLLNTFYP